jgi:hypothetical protein
MWEKHKKAICKSAKFLIEFGDILRSLFMRVAEARNVIV